MPAIKIAARKAIATSVGALLLCAAIVPGEAQLGGRRAPGYALKEPSTPEEIEAAKPNPQSPGFRVPLPPLDQMDPAMRADFESNAKRLKTPVPPTAPLLLTPEVKAAMGGMAGALYKTAIAQDLLELTILVVAREWRTQFEWFVHAPQAVLEGVPADVVDAIRLGRRPTFTSPGQEATYHYLVELMRDHKVSDATYERLRAIIGARQMVEITVLAGYYNIDAMNFAAHNLPFRADIKPPLPELANAFPR